MQSSHLRGLTQYSFNSILFLLVGKLNHFSSESLNVIVILEEWRNMAQQYLYGQHPYQQPEPEVIPYHPYPIQQSPLWELPDLPDAQDPRPYIRLLLYTRTRPVERLEEKRRNLKIVDLHTNAVITRIQTAAIYILVNSKVT